MEKLQVAIENTLVLATFDEFDICVTLIFLHVEQHFFTTLGNY